VLQHWMVVRCSDQFSGVAAVLCSAVVLGAGEQLQAEQLRLFFLAGLA
jgi:hypothetical protein